MVNKKFGIAVLTTPLLFTLNAQDIKIPQNIVKKDISPQAIQKIEKIGSRHQDKAKSFVELGEPWIEWSQEQKDIKKDQIKHAYPDKINTLDAYKRNLPRKGMTLQKENIKIIKP